MFVKRVTFSVVDETLVGNIIREDEVDVPSVLFLHGGGESTKERTEYLAVKLANKGFPSLSFDFSGHGESSGTLANSSLKKRIKEAEAAMQFLAKDKPITVIGSSMGAYIALELLKDFDIQNVTLFCPAIYDRKAVDMKFGGGFTETIRKKDSWKNSDIFIPLERYKGSLLVIIGTNDEVIPEGVIEILDKNSQNVKRKEIVKIPNCPHKIHSFLYFYEKLANKVTDKIIEFISQRRIPRSLLRGSS